MTLVESFRMAELALTLNSFVFNGEHYKQIGGVAMGSKLGPNYVCLFVGYVKEKMLREYTGIKPDLLMYLIATLGSVHE